MDRGGRCALHPPASFFLCKKKSTLPHLSLNWQQLEALYTLLPLEVSLMIFTKKFKQLSPDNVFSFSFSF